MVSSSPTSSALSVPVLDSSSNLALTSSSTPAISESTSASDIGSSSSPEFGTSSAPMSDASSDSTFTFCILPPLSVCPTSAFGSPSPLAFDGSSASGFGASSAPMVGSSSTSAFTSSSTDPEFGESSALGFDISSVPILGTTPVSCQSISASASGASTSNAPASATSSTPTITSSSVPAFSTSASPFGASSSLSDPEFISSSTSALCQTTSTSAFGASSAPTFISSLNPAVSQANSTSAFEAPASGGSIASGFGSFTDIASLSTPSNTLPFGFSFATPICFDGSSVSASTLGSSNISGLASFGSGKQGSPFAMPFYKYISLEELRSGYRYDQAAGGITYGVSTSNPTSFGATSTIHSCPLPASFSSSPLLCSLPSGSSSAQDHTQATPSTIPFVNTTSSPTGILPVLNVPNIQLFPLPQLVAPTFQLTNAVAGQGISFVHGITPQSYTLGMPIAPAFGQLVFTSLPLQYPGHVTGSGQSIGLLALLQPICAFSVDNSAQSPPSGLEPATFALLARRSNPLS
uniref:Uncharacterized protein n=1 Tax=Manihot esculenta TaxID=3983 RepID=A0A2C9U5G9_MANES